jgi:hypothetical protein
MNLNSNTDHHRGQNQASKSTPHIFTSGTFELAWKFIRTSEKFEPFSTSTFGTSNFGRVHCVPVCDCDNGKKVQIGCNTIQHIPH